MTYPVKWFKENMLDIADLTEFSPGGLFNVLKACLIDGFNTQVPTGMTWANGEITIEFGVAHGYVKHQIIKTSGADQAVYNGEFRVKAISATAVTVPPHNGTPAGDATTATAYSCFCPPIDGWEIIHDVGDPTYELHLGRTDPNATSYKLLVYNDVSYDTNPEVEGQFLAKMVVVDNWTDSSTFDIISTRYWPAGYRYADKQEYLILGDKYMFVFVNKYGNNEGNTSTYVFGDINSVVKGDVGHCIINGCNPASTSSRWDSESYYAHTTWTMWNNITYERMMTDYTGNQGTVTWQMAGMDSHSANTFSYPNPGTHGFHVFAGPIFVRNGSAVRGHMPGLMQPMHRNDAWHRKVVDTLPGLEGVPVIFWNSSHHINNDYATYKRLTCWRMDDWARDVDL
jgi:hypothetical protein